MTPTTPITANGSHRKNGSCPKRKSHVSLKLPRDFLNVYCAKWL